MRNILGHKLREIEQIILAQEKIVQETYDKLIATADNYFNKQEYDQAKIKYQNALKNKPDEVYPVQKLGEIEGLVSDLEMLKANYQG